MNQNDGYMYLFAGVPDAPTPGVRVARAPIDQPDQKLLVRHTALDAVHGRGD